MEHHTVQSLYTLNLLALPKPIISRPKRRYSVTSAGLQGIRAAKYLVLLTQLPQTLCEHNQRSVWLASNPLKSALLLTLALWMFGEW